MINKIQTILYLSVLVLLLVGGYFFYKYAYNKGYKERRSQEQEVVIKDFDTASVIQKARLNWLPKSKVDSLLKGKSITKVRWVDEWRIRDSINIKDSLITYPVYESDTSFVLQVIDEFAGEVSVGLTLTQKFLLYQEMFASNMIIDFVKIDKGKGPDKEVEYLPYRFSVIGGVKNRFDKDVLLYVGAEYNIFDYRYLQLYLGGEGIYMINKKNWEMESKLGVRVKF